MTKQEIIEQVLSEFDKEFHVRDSLPSGLIREIFKEQPQPYYIKKFIEDLLTKLMMDEEEVFKLILEQKFFSNSKGWVRVARPDESSFELARSLIQHQQDKIK